MNPKHNYAVTILWGPANAPTRTFNSLEEANTAFNEIVNEYDNLDFDPSLPIVVLYQKVDGLWVRYDWATFQSLA